MSYNEMGTAVHIVASISMRHGTQNVVQCPQMDVVADGMTELGEYILSLCERRADRLSALSVTIRDLIENNDAATVATELQNVGLRVEVTTREAGPHIKVMLG